MRKIVILFFLLISPNLFGMVLTFEEAKDVALKNNNLIKAYEEEAKSAEYFLSLAKGGYLPKIDISETVISTDEPASAAFAKMAQGRFDFNYFNNQLSNPDSVTGYETKIEIIQPIYMKGKIYFGIKQAKELFDAKKLNLNRVKENVILNLFESYYGKGVAERALEVVKKSAERTQKYYEMTQDFYKNGLLVKSDLLVAESHLYQNEEALISARKQIEVAQSYLQRILNSEEDIQVVWEGFQKTLPSAISALKEIAYKNRNDLKALGKYAEITNLEVKKSKSEFAPEVLAFGNYKINDDSLLGDNGRGFTLGVTAKINIFDGFSTSNKIKQSKSNQVALNYKIIDKKLEIASEVKSAWYSVKAAFEKLQANKKQLEASLKALEISENRFKEGLVKVTELLDREVEVKDAELKLTMAEYEVILNRAHLDFATGELK